MINPLINWWRSQQFSTALKQGNTRKAEQLLKEIQNSTTRLSSLEKLFQDKLQSDRSTYEHKKEAVTLREQLSQALERIEELEQNEGFEQSAPSLFKPAPQLIHYISNSFQLIQHDEHKLQCTGIDELVFDKFESSLVEYLKQEFGKSHHDKIKIGIKEAYNDIIRLKNGKNPEYNLDLTPHVYFMNYFLENVYGAYLAWFLIYKYGVLPTKINILDIAAGPATMAYGLALFLQSASSCLQIPQTHISYYSLEKQSSFQYRGLQFWRRYLEQQQIGTNAYFRFDTTDIFANDDKLKKLPQDFFDFIVISHCFFSDAEQRTQSYKIYKEVFSTCLRSQGYVLLIIQGRKLFKFYNIRQSEDGKHENNVLTRFIKELGLNLEWYTYVTSTGRRTPSTSSDFTRFANDNLPAQKQMLPLMQEYLGIKHGLNYVLDDYVILAKK